MQRPGDRTARIDHQDADLILVLDDFKNLNQQLSCTAGRQDAPDTPVFNAFLALKKGDLATARAQYSAQVLKDAAGDKGYGPLRGETYGYGDAARRLRVTDVKLDPQDADRAYVTVAIDTYSTGGIFNSGSTWTSERTVEVVREDGAWKINAQEYFW